jgi:predicted nucleic acid-binding protein
VSRVLLDTSCLVAAACGWHEHHLATAEAITRLKRRHQMVLAAHGLVEAYAVLTRLPGNRRLPAAQALELLRANWAGAEVVSLSPTEYWKALSDSVAAGITGGRAYDALIAACAVKGRASQLLTWNVGHFQGLGLEGLEARSPADA